MESIIPVREIKLCDVYELFQPEEKEYKFFKKLEEDGLVDFHITVAVSGTKTSDRKQVTEAMNLLISDSRTEVIEL